MSGNSTLVRDRLAGDQSEGKSLRQSVAGDVAGGAMSGHGRRGAAGRQQSGDRGAVGAEYAGGAIHPQAALGVRERPGGLCRHVRRDDLFPGNFSAERIRRIARD